MISEQARDLAAEPPLVFGKALSHALEDLMVSLYLSCYLVSYWVLPETVLILFFAPSTLYICRLLQEFHSSGKLLASPVRILLPLYRIPAI